MIVAETGVSRAVAAVTGIASPAVSVAPHCASALGTVVLSLGHGFFTPFT
jgi:hypothetical protein